MVKSPLQQPNFQCLWVGQSLLLFSEEIWLVALTWLVLQETGSGFVLGVILMAGAIPSALLSLVGGAISDRFPSHRVATMVAIIDTSLAGLMVLLLWLNIFNTALAGLSIAAFGII